MKSLNSIVSCLLSTICGLILLLPTAVSAQTAATGSMSIPIEGVAPLGDILVVNPTIFDISSDSGGLSLKVAPGEILPISIKLANFGGGKKVDVLVAYSIISNTGKEIYSITETVAVETTANFIKTIPIPPDTAPGIYTAKTSITYPGQVSPATTQFLFTVESKILGLYQDDFYWYGGTAVIICILTVLICYAVIRQGRKARFTPFDYSAIPRDKRTFYEILSDTIMQMRQRVGDDALHIASHIDGLKIDEETGRVLALAGSPSKIIADLVTEYEKLLGKRVSFSLRQKK